MMSREIPTPEQVAHLLDRVGWTASDLAYNLGVTPGAVSRWCSGGSPMKGVYWWVFRADVAADLGVFAWPPPSFDELMKLLKGRR